MGRRSIKIQVKSGGRPVKAGSGDNYSGGLPTKKIIKIKKKTRS